MKATRKSNLKSLCLITQPPHKLTKIRGKGQVKTRKKIKKLKESKNQIEAGKRKEGHGGSPGGFAVEVAWFFPGKDHKEA
jgi:hypothetical protein